LQLSRASRLRRTEANALNDVAVIYTSNAGREKTDAEEAYGEENKSQENKPVCETGGNLFGRTSA